MSWSCILHGQLKTAPDPTLESPYNTMNVHLYFLQSETYEPEISALTIAPGVVDSLKAQQIAIKIKQIFDGKGLFVRMNDIPQNNDFIDTLNQDHFYTPFINEVPEIYLERIDGKWYYSTETVQLVPQVHRRIYPLGSDFLVRILPKRANAQFLGLFLWQHIGMIIITVLGFLVFIFFDLFLHWIIRLFTTRRESWQFVRRKQTKRLARLISIALALWVCRMLIPAVQLPVKVTEFLNTSIDIIATLMVLIVALILVDVFTRRIEPVTEETESKLDEQLLPILNKMAKVLVVIVGIFYILDLLNVNVTALIAGISIGGLALALAAQDTVKHLIGSAMIFVDRPFQIGDYVLAGGHEGTIVEVGFRSTRIMQIDTSIIAIPNGTIANMPITNLGVREARICNISLGVLYETPPEKIELFIERLRELVLSHEHTKHDLYYVHLKEFADSSINIMFRCYIVVPTYAEELQVKEDILFRILRIAQDIGVEFAYPTTMLHIGASADALTPSKE